MAWAASDSWVAIDFETASTRGTPCSVGLAEVDAGQVVAEHTWLIRPPTFEFAPFNVALNGITPEDCADAPDWDSSLAEILKIVDGRTVVAHNASFDLGVIRDACDEIECAWPSLNYACTLVLSRRLWPELTSHSLPFVASYLGIVEVAHHDAAEDATVAAEIGLAALGEKSCASFNDLADQLGVLIGSLSADQWSGCHGRDYQIRPPLPLEPSADADLDPAHPLYGKSVTFTGTLAVPRRQAQQAVVDHGGSVTRGPTKETDLLVTGYQDLTCLAVGATKSAKLQKAEALKAAGQELEIIGEAEFVQLLAGQDTTLSGKRSATLV
jgi:DNA polymerase III epsilon subunit-like protein